MGKNKKRKNNKRNASKHLEEIIQLQKKRAKTLLQQQQEKSDNHYDDDDDNDNDDTLLHITSSETNVGGDLGGADTPSTNNATTGVTISQKELQCTIDTLNKISPDLLQTSPICRDLRKALHPHTIKQMQKYEQKIDYRIKVTNCLHEKQWSSSLLALEACKDFHHIPKQGTVQRWVRDCNTAQPPTLKLKLLSAILSLNDNNDTNVQQEEDPSSTSASTNIINQHDPAQALLLSKAEAAAAAAATSATVSSSVAASKDGDTENEHDDNDLTILEPWSIVNQTKKNSNTEKEEEAQTIPKFPISESQSCIIYQEQASERKPPNKYDLLLHYTPKPLISFAHQREEDCNSNNIQKHTVEFLKDPNSTYTTPFLLENVLSSTECQQLMGAATTLGYRPDHPLSLERPTGIDSCEWLMDSKTLSTILERVKDYLPSTINVNPNNPNQHFHLHSINSRWRFFRYSQNCVYRPHLDGSWPASWVTTTTRKLSHQEEDEEEEDGNSEKDNDNKESISSSSCQYVYSTGEKPSSSDSTSSSSAVAAAENTSSTTSTTRSYLTFLIYLNDNFDGGHTRFYFTNNNNNNNSNKMTTTMMARGVQPVQGSVLVFPQGNTASLIHEGSAVAKGTKYVVRTDVIYSSKTITTTTTTSSE